MYCSLPSLPSLIQVEQAEYRHSVQQVSTHSMAQPQSPKGKWQAAAHSFEGRSRSDPGSRPDAFPAHHSVDAMLWHHCCNAWLTRLPEPMAYQSTIAKPTTNTNGHHGSCMTKISTAGNHSLRWSPACAPNVPPERKCWG